MMHSRACRAKNSMVHHWHAVHRTPWFIYMFDFEFLVVVTPETLPYCPIFHNSHLQLHDPIRGSQAQREQLSTTSKRNRNWCLRDTNIIWWKCLRLRKNYAFTRLVIFILCFFLMIQGTKTKGSHVLAKHHLWAVLCLFSNALIIEEKHLGALRKVITKHTTEWDTYQFHKNINISVKLLKCCICVGSLQLECRWLWTTWWLAGSQLWVLCKNNCLNHCFSTLLIKYFKQKIYTNVI
jgi:hypothetical protein